MTEFNFPAGRNSKLSDEQAADIILNCKDASQDAEYARKYGLKPTTVGHIRRGRVWCKLRAKLEGRGRYV